MTKFFFHVRDASGISRDLEGQELPDLDAARHEAVNTNREILGEKLLHGGSLNGRQIEIADEAGAIMAVINARDVLFKGDQLRSFDDDVTQSAPVTNPISEKPSAE